MKKRQVKQKGDDDLRDHYDFSGGVRGKHFKRFREGTNLILLAPDVAKVFKNAEAVNSALRSLIEVAGKVGKPTKKVAKSA
jgi:hypothetical protein